MKKPLLKQKTFWSAMVLIASQVLPAFGVPPQTVHIIQVTIAALTAIFLRQGFKE